jgi:hypothetical protein
MAATLGKALHDASLVPQGRFKPLHMHMLSKALGYRL